ncbi:hypothetical protein NE647_01600 [Blautia coccoides]|uniref:hypothetical protein n=1 Tax=Blautia producta TaxID=33035 RepID=UPI0004954AFD|nr:MULTISPECIES: hypothetical protein [Blautia]MCB5877115.1 hypothetical protein [Blautia producta]MCB6783801.1 hypothetical protein [Blautia producta]MCQ4639131.1 hypothetical protein [Blautia coccoides]MCQ5127023.1 hypothetical protein [Blautia producta]MDT4375886.1 hypothetical protein [Blautia coccoides]
MKISNRSVNKCGRESLLFRLWLPHLFFILEEYQIWRGFEGFRETEEKKNRIVKYAEEKRGRLKGVSGIWRGRWYRILKACF